jgi:hypothetical protein
MGKQDVGTGSGGRAKQRVTGYLLRTKIHQ